MSNLKKTTAVLFAALYLLQTNYCLVSATVTGGFHHSHPASEIDSDHDHSSHDHNNEGHRHDHGSSNDSDHCCTKVAKDFPALLPNTHISVKPHAWTVSLAMLPAELFTSAEPNHSYLKDHDPPGLFPQRLFFSHLTSRAPPSLKSL